VMDDHFIRHIFIRKFYIVWPTVAFVIVQLENDAGTLAVAAV